MSNPLSIFQKWEREAPNRLLYHQPIAGKTLTFTYAEAGREARCIASALKAMSLPPRSRVAILSKNCAHWMIADLAIWMAGHISVPIYPTLSSRSIAPILEHSGTQVIFVGKLDDYASQRDGIAPHIQKVSFPFYGIEDGWRWEELVSKHEPLAEVATFDPKEVATIKYTSGTTGDPKGVMLSFEGINHALAHAFRVLGTDQDDRFFSYLPLSHIAERMLVEMGVIYNGASVYFSESIEKFPQDLAHAEPTIFLAVPRIWSKFREKILEKLPQKKLSMLLSIPVVNAIIKKQIRKKLGLGKAKWTLTGASPITVELLEWYERLGITIREVYGMTENLAYAYSNVDAIKFGSVGKVWSNVEARLSSEGEIQTKSPATMLGYYRNEALTRETFTDDGFLKSGDVGEIDKDGFLTITGRIKDQFKTDKGKYIAPSPIELKLSKNSDLDQVCVVGMGVPQPIVLVVLSAAGKTKSREQLTTSLSDTLNEVNQELESYERLQAAVVMKHDWTIENGLMTPSLKVKRTEVEKIHLPKYPHWYGLGRKVVWEEE